MQERSNDDKPPELTSRSFTEAIGPGQIHHVSEVDLTAAASKGALLPSAIVAPAYHDYEHALITTMNTTNKSKQAPGWR